MPDLITADEYAKEAHSMLERAQRHLDDLREQHAKTVAQIEDAERVVAMARAASVAYGEDERPVLYD